MSTPLCRLSNFWPKWTVTGTGRKWKVTNHLTYNFYICNCCPIALLTIGLRPYSHSCSACNAATLVWVSGGVGQKLACIKGLCKLTDKASKKSLYPCENFTIFFNKIEPNVLCFGCTEV